MVLFPRRFVLLAFAAVMGFALGGSFVWGVLYTPPTSNQRPAEQAEHSDTAPAHAADQKETSSDAPAPIPHIPSGDLSRKSPSDDNGSREQPEKSWREKF